MKVQSAAALAGLLLGVGCSGNDSRCSVANCEILGSCGLGLPGQVQVSDAIACENGGLSSTSQISSYCVMACEANGDGATVGCVVSKFPNGCAPADGGLMNWAEIEREIAAACPGPACGSNCMSCLTACESKRAGCNRACTDAGVCLDCEYQCSQAYVSCENACPTN